MAPSNIAKRDTYDKDTKQRSLIEGTKYKTQRLVTGRRTEQRVVNHVTVQEVVHKPNIRDGKVGYTPRAPKKPTYVQPYTQKFVPRGKDKVRRSDRLDLISSTIMQPGMALSQQPR